MAVTATAIPPTIHHIWLGGPMPDHLQTYRQSVLDMHPDWEHRLWGDDDLDWLTNRDLFDRASEVTPGHEGQLRSDIARYEILARHGGVYVDCDMEARKPLDELLVHAGGFAAYELDGVWVNNAVIGSPPSGLFVTRMIERIPGSVARADGKGWRPNRITGPHLATQVAHQRRMRGLFRVLPSVTFYPYSWDELDRGDEEHPESFMVHHWENQRKLRGVPRG